HWLSLQTAEPFGAEPLGGLRQIDKRTAADADNPWDDLVEAGGPLYDLAQSPAGAAVRVATKRAQLAAEISIDCASSKNEHHCTWEIAIQPEHNALDRFLLYSTSPLRDDVRWTERSTHAPVVAVRIDANSPLHTGLPPEGELWQLRLQQPTNQPIRVQAESLITTSEADRIPLVAVLDAMRQSGRVLLRGELKTPPVIETSGLVPTPLPPDPPKRLQRASGRSSSLLPPVLASYRYDPSDCLDATRRTRLAIQSAEPLGSASVVVRHLAIESYYWPQGRSSHRMTFDLVNRGANEFQPTLPTEARVMTVYANGKVISMSQSVGASPFPPIPLPAEEKFVRAVVEFELEQSPWASAAELRAPVIAGSAPVLGGEWKAWLPDDYEARIAQPSGEHRFDWRERLFGPLARKNHQTVFRPFRSGDWAALINGLVDWNSSPLVAEPTEGIDPPMPRHDLAASTPLGPIPGVLSVNLFPLTWAATAYATQPAAPLKVLPGWHSVSQSFVGESSPLPIFASRPALIDCWTLALALGSLLLGTLFGKRYVRLIALLALIAACGAMLLSFPYAAYATGTMWGLLLAAARNALVWRRDNPTDRKTNESRERSARPAIILRSVLLTGFALAALMGNSRLLRAAETVASAAPSIEQVLIPIDAARQPVGSKLFVSEHFLRTILQSRSTADDAAPQWLLHGATYHCEMSGVQKQSGITPGNCDLAFSIETLARSTRIVLPLDQSEASWQPSAMLDGVPLPIVWSKDGRSCELLVPDPGRYVLTFLCVPKVMKQEGRERLRLKVPPVMSATIEVRLPAAIKGLRIEQCKLQAGPKSVLGLVKGELVSSNVVDVNWPGHTGQSDAGNELRILEMKWLDIGSKETTLRAKYQIEGDSRNTGGLRIRYDKHWLLQQTGEFMITPDAQAADESKRWRTVTVPLSSDDGQRQEVELGWVLRDAPQAGHLHVPVIEVVSAPVSQSWLALSSSAEFDCSLATNGGTSITVPEFLSRWGAQAGRQSHNRTPPTLALASTEAGREWIATIKPKLVPGEIREAVHCAAGTTMASVAYRANVTPGSTHQFQFSVQVPTSLRIESVQVAEGDRSIPVRWARGSEDTLHVFFSRQATSKYRLAILGHMPIEMEQTVSIPRFDAVENSKAAAASLQQFYFYREDSVNVEPARFPEASVLTSDSLDPPPASWRVRPIGVYQMDAEQSRTATFRVQSMKNEMRGDSVISLSREGAAWSVRYRVSLSTNLGAIDGARIHLPADCLGPYQVVGSVPLVAEVPEPKEHGVVIPVRFVNSLKTGEETTIQVKCQLATFPAILISVPHITVEGLSGGRRFVTVPTSLDGQQLTWTTASAAAAELPPSLAIPDAIQSNDAVYEYAKESFQVAIPAVRTHEPAPRIRFADVAASVGERGGQAVVSRFILSPDGIAECVLKLPADQELISVEIDGYPAIASFAGASRWRVPLRSPQLPGVLEVVSSFQSDSQSAQQAAVERPMLLSGDRPVPVELCLWTVTAPAFQQSSRVTGATAVREGEQALLRFERLISTVETYLPALSTVPAEEVANWGRPWVELLSDLQSQVQEATSKPKTVSQLAQISPSREEVELVAKRLDVWIEALKNLTATQTMPSSRIHLPWTVPAAVKSGASSTADLQLTRYYVSDGTTVRVALHRAAGAIPTHLARWLSVGALTLLFAAVISLGRFPIVGDCLSRWPHVLGVVIGLLYWAWLWPSWLGLLIIVASLWATLRFNWPGHSLRPEASTVLRSTRTR
ncbi:MAG: hypothetical protein IT425_06710, partial [Pirellulales bacterium]|nr:hypothetical protein [Pirellulales bacterium]